MSRNRITHIYPRDTQAFSALGRCGHVSHEQLGEFLRDKRIRDYERSGLVERVLYARPGDGESDRTCYRLTRKGREFCRHELHMTDMYRTQSVGHDIALADRYFSLSREERETWQTETVIMDRAWGHIRELEERGELERAEELAAQLRAGEISMPDAVYETGGHEIAFEVVTNNYGTAEIEGKIEICRELDIEYTQQRG